MRAHVDAYKWYIPPISETFITPALREREDGWESCVHSGF